ncbi:hypothetical protein [Kingella potus]|uniref:hypothetical protein n=1 Tax=Kingella potus TaxID=265175 RepID=UPI000E1C3A14|nr:hypothetical protein [Kingella potus]UOO99991.1 hypothetical protein LVJ84_08155 [Kingella potus]
MAAFAHSKLNMAIISRETSEQTKKSAATENSGRKVFLGVVLNMMSADTAFAVYEAGTGGGLVFQAV